MDFAAKTAGLAMPATTARSNAEPSVDASLANNPFVVVDV